MIRVHLALLAVGVSLLTACNHSSSAAVSQQPDPAVQLQQIPTANPGEYEKINVRSWKNPYLIVKPDSIALLDVANHEEKLLKPEELPAALARLPQSAWPYGRVVAVAVSETAASEDDKARLRKNRALVAGTLKDMQIWVNYVPFS